MQSRIKLLVGFVALIQAAVVRFKISAFLVHKKGARVGEELRKIKSSRVENVLTYSLRYNVA